MLFNPLHLILGILGILVFGLLSLKTGVLDNLGFASATVVGCLVLVFGGYRWLLVLVSFLIFASLCTKYGYDRKRTLCSIKENLGARSWKNVVANGLTASLSALGHGVTHLIYGVNSPTIFSYAFLGVVSTAAADTIATEIGLLSGSEPRLITSLDKRVERGASGGVTPLGITASLLGALSMGFMAWIFGFDDLRLFKTLYIVLTAGFLGSVMDSVMGATVQSYYQCPICGSRTEGKIHCGQPTRLVGGFSVIDNNMVNFISTLLGALIAVILSFTLNTQ